MISHLRLLTVMEAQPTHNRYGSVSQQSGQSFPKYFIQVKSYNCYFYYVSYNNKKKKKPLKQIYLGLFDTVMIVDIFIL